MKGLPTWTPAIPITPAERPNTSRNTLTSHNIAKPPVTKYSLQPRTCPDHLGHPSLQRHSFFLNYEARGGGGTPFVVNRHTASTLRRLLFLQRTALTDHLAAPISEGPQQFATSLLLEVAVGAEPAVKARYLSSSLRYRQPKRYTTNLPNREGKVLPR